MNGCWPICGKRRDPQNGEKHHVEAKKTPALGGHFERSQLPQGWQLPRKNTASRSDYLGGDFQRATCLCASQPWASFWEIFPTSP